jgi:hypothetical protein
MPNVLTGLVAQEIRGDLKQIEALFVRGNDDAGRREPGERFLHRILGRMRIAQPMLEEAQ